MFNDERVFVFRIEPRKLTLIIKISSMTNPNNDINCPKTGNVIINGQLSSRNSVPFLAHMKR